MKIIWLILFLFPLNLVAQVTISGTVTDANSNQPVPYTTIYINGTTNGTITNIDGEFHLEDVVPPCEIVFSHISYSPEAIVLQEAADKVFHIQLKPRDVKLGAVEVKDKNRRRENLRHFKERFLGTDYWGEHAYFENDSVLIFHREKVTESEGYEHESGRLSGDSSSYWFVVNTKGPLIVQKPLLGYKVHVNLIHYTELHTGSKEEYEFHTLGYFYFQPDENASGRKTNRFRKKRLEAYYNSDRHFCRSLFQNRLKENGYYFFKWWTNPETLQRIDKEFPIGNYINRNENEAKIIGLKNKGFNIGYYQIFNAPMNLKERRREGRPEMSNIYFLKDTCTIRADGSRPDNSIMFGPEIGKKRVGAMLPNDFQPKK